MRRSGIFLKRSADKKDGDALLCESPSIYLLLSLFYGSLPSDIVRNKTDSMIRMIPTADLTVIVS